MDERDRTQNFMWGDFWADNDELDARRSFMIGEGYSLCSIPACNCGSWHGGHASRRLSEIRDMLDEMEVPTNGVVLRDAISGAVNISHNLREAIAAIQLVNSDLVHSPAIAEVCDRALADDAEEQV